MAATFNLPAATADNIRLHCWFAVEVFLTVSMLIYRDESATTIRVGGAVANPGANLPVLLPA